jgi:protein-S-isoprenylcysteine O-methyltransferase Ste14
MRQVKQGTTLSSRAFAFLRHAHSNIVTQMMQSILSTIQQHLFLPLPFTVWPVPYFIPFWIIYLWNFLQERRLKQNAIRSGKDSNGLDRGSFQLILWSSRLSRVAGYSLAFLMPPWPLGNQRILLYFLGLMCMLSGALLRKKCFKLLGRSFTFSVTVPVSCIIVEDGMYRLVRHPSYTGGFMFILGLGLASTNLWSLVVLTIPAVIMFWYRVRVEERFLIDSLGSAYIDYMRRTKRFIPYIF